jgi:hypothetical protein
MAFSGTHEGLEADRRAAREPRATGGYLRRRSSDAAGRQPFVSPTAENQRAAAAVTMDTITHSQILNTRSYSSRHRVSSPGGLGGGGGEGGEGGGPAAGPEVRPNSLSIFLLALEGGLGGRGGGGSGGGVGGGGISAAAFNLATSAASAAATSAAASAFCRCPSRVWLRLAAASLTRRGVPASGAAGSSCAIPASSFRFLASIRLTTSGARCMPCSSIHDSCLRLSLRRCASRRSEGLGLGCRQGT